MSISFDNFVAQNPILNGIFGIGEKDFNPRSLREKGTPIYSPGGGEYGE